MPRTTPSPRLASPGRGLLRRPGADGASARALRQRGAVLGWGFSRSSPAITNRGDRARGRPGRTRRRGGANVAADGSWRGWPPGSATRNRPLAAARPRACGGGGGAVSERGPGRREEADGVAVDAAGCPGHDQAWGGRGEPSPRSTCFRATGDHGVSVEREDGSSTRPADRAALGAEDDEVSTTRRRIGVTVDEIGRIVICVPSPQGAAHVVSGTRSPILNYWRDCEFTGRD